MRILIVLLFPFFVSAESLLGYGTGAYMGRHQFQGETLLKKPKYYMTHLIGILGYTQDQGLNEIYQITLIGLHSFMTKDLENFKWIPIRAGGFMTYTNHKKFFIESPSKYKDPDYYTETAFRVGLRFGSELIFMMKSQKPLHLSFDGSLADRGITSFFNNPSEFQIIEKFWSIGFSVRLEI